MDGGFLVRAGLAKGAAGSMERLLETADSGVDDSGVVVAFGLQRVGISSTRLSFDVYQTSLS